MSQQLQTVRSDVPLVVHPLADRTYYADFTALLPAAGTLATATVDADDPDELTVGSAAVNTAETFLNRRGQTVALSKGVTFTMSGGVAGTDYLVTVSVTLTGGGSDALAIPVQVRDGSETDA